MENLERDVLAYQALTYSLKLFCERNKLDYWQKLKLAFSTNFKQNLETDSKLVEKATKLVEQFSSVRDSSIPHLPAIIAVFIQKEDINQNEQKKKSNHQRKEKK